MFRSSQAGVKPTRHVTYVAAKLYFNYWFQTRLSRVQGDISM